MDPLVNEPNTNHDEPDGGVEPPFPHPPEPVSQDEELAVVADKVASITPIHGSRGQRHQIRDDRIALLAALGRTPKKIAESLGITSQTVNARLRDEEVIKGVVAHRRIIVDALRGKLLKSWAKAHQMLEKHQEWKDPEPDTREDRAWLLKKKKHEFEANKFIFEQAVHFTLQDHALQKLEEKYHGPRTVGGGVNLQINNSVEQPSDRALAVEQIIRRFPAARQREIVGETRQIIDTEPEAKTG